MLLLKLSLSYSKHTVLHNHYKLGNVNEADDQWEYWDTGHLSITIILFYFLNTTFYWGRNDQNSKSKSKWRFHGSNYNKQMIYIYFPNSWVGEGEGNKQRSSAFKLFSLEGEGIFAVGGGGFVLCLFLKKKSYGWWSNRNCKNKNWTCLFCFVLLYFAL